MISLYWLWTQDTVLLWIIFNIPPQICNSTWEEKLSGNHNFGSPYSASEEEGCASAFPKLASWANPSASLHGKLPCSERPVLPCCHCAWYVGGAQIVLEWTNLFELCLCLHFLLTRNCLPCRCLQEFRLWVWHYLLCEHTALCSFFRWRWWCLSIDSNTCFYNGVYTPDNTYSESKGISY